MNVVAGSARLITVVSFLTAVVGLVIICLELIGFDNMPGVEMQTPIGIGLFGYVLAAGMLLERKKPGMEFAVPILSMVQIVVLVIELPWIASHVERPTFLLQSALFFAPLVIAVITGFLLFGVARLFEYVTDGFRHPNQ